MISRRQLIQTAALASGTLLAQTPGERPLRAPSVTVLNPRTRVPIGLIIDDSTCLVNLNRYAMPQFDTAFAGANPAYHKPWREWPIEIPDSFVRRFGEWSAAEGIKGKYSIVPFPACVGRVDRTLPGWTEAELAASLDLVRGTIMPNWDIHPEMVTHTRVIDVKTGHPYPQHSVKFMENWDWTTGRSADEIGGYLAYALGILREAGLPCEGVTTPGGFGGRALPQLAQGSAEALRQVFQAEIPHYFRHCYDSGDRSVLPRVENVSGLGTDDPRCVVSIIGCTGDWTGGWDCSEPTGVDRFITEDLKSGRMVDIIERGEPAMMLAHWTGFYFNGKELGFDIFKEVVRRLRARYDNLHWMKLTELARYWAARELTQIESSPERITFRGPYACPDFTVRCELPPGAHPTLKLVGGPLQLAPGTWCRTEGGVIACFALAKGVSHLEIKG